MHPFSRSLLRSLLPAVAAIAVATLGACTTVTEPRGELRTSLTLGSELQVQHPSSVAPYDTRLVMRGGGFDVLGRFQLPTPCYTLSSAVHVQETVLTVVMTAAAQSSGPCIQVVALREYVTAVRGVTPGQYTVRVVHALAHMSDTGQVVLEQQVVVR